MSGAVRTVRTVLGGAVSGKKRAGYGKTGIADLKPPANGCDVRQLGEESVSRQLFPNLDKGVDAGGETSIASTNMHDFVNQYRIDAFFVGIEMRGAYIDEDDILGSALLFVVIDLLTANFAETIKINGEILLVFHIVHGSMNNMKSKVKSKSSAPSIEKSLKHLSLSIGDFIRYWGFRRVHGALWAQLYLSKKPLSCTDLVSRLDFSKALISPALEELLKLKLIEEGPAPNEKTKVYRAVDNFDAVIRHVLKTREAKMLQQITQNLISLQQSSLSSDQIDGGRLEALSQMIGSANVMLNLLISQKDILRFPLELEQ